MTQPIQIIGGRLAMTAAHGFRIRGNATDGFWIEDTDSFCNWGTVRRDNRAGNWPTREAAESAAWLCDEFKCGRLSYLHLD